MPFNNDDSPQEQAYKIALVCYCGSDNDNYVLASKIRSADIIIAVDSGLDYLYKAQIMADYAVGDFDSVVDFRLLQSWVKKQVITLPKIKNKTDLRAALDFARNNFLNVTKYEIYTEFSGRIDQQLGVISQLLYLHDMQISSVIYSSTQYLYLLAPGSARITPSKKHKYISFIAVSATAEFTYSYGLQYPLNDLCLTRFAETGISNQILDESALLELKSGLVLCIETFE